MEATARHEEGGHGEEEEEELVALPGRYSKQLMTRGNFGANCLSLCLVGECVYCVLYCTFFPFFQAGSPILSPVGTGLLHLIRSCGLTCMQGPRGDDELHDSVDDDLDAIEVLYFCKSALFFTSTQHFNKVFFLFTYTAENRAERTEAINLPLFESFLYFSIKYGK